MRVRIVSLREYPQQESFVAECRTEYPQHRDNGQNVFVTVSIACIYLIPLCTASGAENFSPTFLQS